MYLLHPPGGMAGHDQLTINVTVAERAHVLLTTPAANKVYRTRGLRSEVIQEIDLAPGCSGEWLPQGTILFGGSSYAQRTVIRAATSARFSCWDSICLGRPASGDDFTQGSGEQSLAVFLDGKPLYLDRLDWTADAPLMCSGWGLQSYKVLSQLLMYPADEDVLERARQVTGDPAWQAVGRVGVTLVDGLLVMRMLGDAAFQVQELLQTLWSRLRPLVMGHAPCPPRIWAT